MFPHCFICTHGSLWKCRPYGNPQRTRIPTGAWKAALSTFPQANPISIFLDSRQHQVSRGWHYYRARSIRPATPRSTGTSRLKVLPEAFTSDPDRLSRFEREAKVLASLNHPEHREHLRAGGS